jgi:hypothetical protein
MHSEPIRKRRNGFEEKGILSLIDYISTSLGLLGNLLNFYDLLQLLLEASSTPSPSCVSFVGK